MIMGTNGIADQHHAEDRFPFGENWRRFLAQLDGRRIRDSEAALAGMLGTDDLAGHSFLDVGSGSGLSSLAARRLGARVRSFDADRDSVACTTELRQRYFPGDPAWIVESGSALDAGYLARLGQFNIVYSWGVLHHTGDLWRALETVLRPVAPGGLLFIAIYRDQGWISRYWEGVKRLYNRGALARALIVSTHAPYLFGARWLVRTLSGRARPERGMSLWHDMLDWLGGWPFETASSDAVIAFVNQRGFRLLRDNPARRHGCNEFVFRRI